ncbi:YagE family protein [Tricharina praecox]|uniref:YagE family protein n=1 Tax=Tricharina praecox TaxID=43433 RepID=UPI00221EF4D9|nr:YagE family protein [Tricharina praecox]KAI5854569.1 YagE family protein [Tricharina praecox]
MSTPRLLLRSLLRPRTPACLASPAAFRFSSANTNSNNNTNNTTPTTAAKIPPAPAPPAQPADLEQFEKKRAARSTTTKSSLRRAAVVSERRRATPPSTLGQKPKVCTAYCTAEKYHIHRAAVLLRGAGYTIDPCNTGLADQVIHLRLDGEGEGDGVGGEKGGDKGDIFIFPSGNIVGWSVHSATVEKLARLVTDAAELPVTRDVETEDLEYADDARVRKSRVAGDVIVLGTAPSFNNHVMSEDSAMEEDSARTTEDDELNLTLAKIAFSSGLARSTKLAVLESLLDRYLQTTATIPTQLSSSGSWQWKRGFTRSFVLRKTGELLQFRAQLNLYSELTDSLPDLFWDSRHELGLEGYYEAVGRALDVDVRIRQLNEKLDYASGIVQVLREQLSEKHSLGLEWMIIALIAVEVGFELVRIYADRTKEGSEAVAYKRWKEDRAREQDKEWQEWKKRNREE